MVGADGAIVGGGAIVGLGPGDAAGSTGAAHAAASRASPATRNGTLDTANPLAGDGTAAASCDKPAVAMRPVTRGANDGARSHSPGSPRTPTATRDRRCARLCRVDRRGR